MKKIFVLAVTILAFALTGSYAQNTFPSTGNVGIGTTTPGHKLHVLGTDGSGSVSPHEDLLHIGGNELGGPGGYAGIKLGGSWDNRYFTYIRAVKTLGYGNYWNTALAFGVTRSYTETMNDEVMRLTSDGNVGIGTATPDSKLTVAGKIHSREVKVTTTAGADFVFEEDYQLRSLAETEKFIKENKHLPGIAPAEEMVDNGINLGEMNIKLLQKIEELTLHLIEKDKMLTEVLCRLKRLEDISR